MSYISTIGVSLGQSQTGLSLAAQIINTTGGIIADNITGGFYELGLGTYLFTYQYFPDDFRGAVKFLNRGNGSGLMAVTAMNPQEVEYSDVKTSTRALPYSQMVQPIFSIPTTADNAALQLRLSDDYEASENRNIDISGTSWPVLTGSTVTLLINGYNSGANSTPFSKTLTILTASSVRIELTKEELASIGAGRFEYEIYTTLTNGNVITLVTGDIEIIPRFSD